MKQQAKTEEDKNNAMEEGENLLKEGETLEANEDEESRNSQQEANKYTKLEVLYNSTFYWIRIQIQNHKKAENLTRIWLQGQNHNTSTGRHVRVKPIFR